MGTPTTLPRYNHYLQAEELLNQAEDFRVDGDLEDATLALAAAQCHATLATAEKVVELQAELHSVRGTGREVDESIEVLG